MYLPTPVPFTQHTLFTKGQSKYRNPNVLWRMAERWHVRRRCTFNMTRSQSIGAWPAGGANAERRGRWQPVARSCHVATASMPFVSAP